MLVEREREREIHLALGLKYIAWTDVLSPSAGHDCVDLTLRIINEEREAFEFMSAHGAAESMRITVAIAVGGGGENPADPTFPQLIIHYESTVFVEERERERERDSDRRSVDVVCGGW